MFNDNICMVVLIENKNYFSFLVCTILKIDLCDFCI